MARAIRSGQVLNQQPTARQHASAVRRRRTLGHRREKGFEALYGFTVLKTVVLRR
jgi:aldehyde dehydrogenase (NAD+)